MIGCGDVTERKSGPGFGKAAHSELVAVMRRNGALAADYARRHGVARWHDAADAIIGADDIDAIYIATLTDTHRDYTLRCAAAGKPVYVEKPMGMNHTECLEMIDACRAAGVPLWVGYYRRALPRFLAVRDLIRDHVARSARQFTAVSAPSAPLIRDAFRACQSELSRGGFSFSRRLPPLRFSDSCSGRSPLPHSAVIICALYARIHPDVTGHVPVASGFSKRRLCKPPLRRLLPRSSAPRTHPLSTSQPSHPDLPRRHLYDFASPIRTPCTSH